jgi:DUF438 domain-containing protein
LHEKYKVLIDILKQLHQGVNTSELREKYRDVLQQISPFEIPIIEQHLVREGIPVTEILKLCDLHVELFRDFIAAREVKDVPESHPLDLLMRENDWILKRAEVLGLYATSLQTTSPETSTSILSSIRFILAELRKIRLHYRKIQMLIFPYLERRGIIAVPRVMWGREDQVVVKLRQLHSKVEDAVAGRGQVDYKVLAQELLTLSREISDLVFRENKILFPAIWALLSEGEWAAIAEIADEMGYIVEVGEKKWKPRAKPILPYELEASSLTPDQLEKLPLEFKQAISRGLEPDTYKLVREGDLDLETGFLNIEELKGVFKALPVELTFAGLDRESDFTARARSLVDS